MPRRWIRRAKLKKGAFKSQATRSGMGVQTYAKKVIAGKPTKGTPSGRYSGTTKRRARLAQTFKRMSKK